MNPKDIYIPILAGTILFIILSFFINILILLFKERRKQHLKEVLLLRQSYEQALLQSQIEVQETTYQHIAKELHDNVGQLLSTTKMLMGVTEMNLGHVPDTLFTANATLGKAIQELRMVSRSLDKDWLEQFNFLENVQNEIDRINSGGVIKAEIECDTDIDMESKSQIILFRISQEAIQNALRHAQPSYLKVTIHTSDKLYVRVINDGKPLPGNLAGMGTRNMLHRVKLFGGDIRWDTQKNETVVTISIPLNQKL
ncbi:MAG TPA: histidine kinase [Chitinophagaceae bacterium]|nr:histidine kinase [Chitinophagaceae bacterium]